MPNTATLHREPGGYAGPARTYRLSEPVDLGGVTTTYVTVWIQHAHGHQRAEVAVVAARDSGACATRSLRRQPGSFVLHHDPQTQDQVDGAYWLALQMLGYTLEDPA